MFKVLLPLAVCFGLLIAYVDSRPNWDDAGITAMALLLTCAGFGAIRPDRPWVWALAVGAWIPIFEVPFSRNWGSLLTLVIAFVGAYAGMGVRKLLGGFKSAQQSP